MESLYSSEYSSEFNKLIGIIHSMVEAEKKTTAGSDMKTKLREAYEAWVRAGQPIKKEQMESHYNPYDYKNVCCCTDIDRWGYCPVHGW